MTPPGSSGIKTITSVVIKAQSDTLPAGDSSRVTATVTAADGSTITNARLNWQSSDTSIARVDSSGLIVTRGVGAFRIAVTASEQGASATASSTVDMLAERTVESISLAHAGATDTVTISDTVRVAAIARDGLGAVFPGVQFLWSVSDTATASVDASGLVTARAMGPVTVTATATGPSDQVRRAVLASAKLTIRLAFTHIEAGNSETCGIARGGSVYCWGDPQWGRLGDGVAYPQISQVAHPVRVQGKSAFVKLMLDKGSDGRGGHACATTIEGALDCWGSGSWGMLGDGADGQAIPPHFVNSPVQVGSGLFVDVGLGSQDTCALTTSGDAYCAGSNFRKQLGVDTVSTVCVESDLPVYYAESCSNTFVKVSGGQRFSEIFVGGTTACGLTSVAAAWCWGANESGEAGVNSTVPQATPVPVQGGLTFSTLAGGAATVCGLTAGGAAYCWGHGTFGELGAGSQVSSSVPVRVGTAQTFAHISAGYDHVCALTTAGDTYCWGGNSRGELGVQTTDVCSDGPSYSEPCSMTAVEVPGVPKFVGISAGFNHTCGLVADGSVYCWGAEDFGQLGNGVSTVATRTAVRVEDTL